MFFTEVDLRVVGRVARMETEAIDIEAEQRKANERIRQIGAQKARQLDDLSSRAQVTMHTVSLTFDPFCCKNRLPNSLLQGGPKSVHFLTHHVFGTVQDKMKRISPKCFYY